MLLDLNLPDSRGIDTFHRINAVTEMPIVVFTVLGNEEDGLAAVRAGAQDYLVKEDVDHRLLPRTLRYAIARHGVVADLQALNSSVERFLAHAVHDLRNPISAVAGLTAIAAEEREELPDEELDDILERAHAQSAELQELVSDLLDLAKAQTEPTLEQVDLRTVVNRAVEDIARIHDQSIEVEVPEHTVLTDAAGLERILVNLLDNACRHGEAPIRVGADQVDGDATLIIEDRGPGVPDDFVERMFTEFERGPDAPPGGTGLGLAIVRRLAQSLDGTVTYDTPADGGARFKVTLPIA